MSNSHHIRQLQRPVSGSLCDPDFGSRNCLREVEATLSQGKGYLFVHEADAGKGGGPLEELQKELKNDGHRTRLFDDAHRVIVWHRIAAFQMVSLVQIAEDMLRQCGGFHERLSLYIPDSVLTQELVIKTRVVLYVSRHNQGAAEVSRELCSRFHEIHTSNAPLPPPRKQSLRKLSWTATSPLGPLAAIQGAATKVTGIRSNSIVLRVVGELSRVRRRASCSKPKPAAEAAEGSTAQPTHFLLYLNEQTYVGDDGGLAQELRQARALGLPIVMIHERDNARGGCEFGNFFETTPQDLIDGGLYSPLAIAFEGGEVHRVVSHKLFAKSLGAAPAQRGDVVSRYLSSRSTSTLSRSTRRSRRSLTADAGRSSIGTDDRGRAMNAGQATMVSAC